MTCALAQIYEGTNQIQRLIIARQIEKEAHDLERMHRAQHRHRGAGRVALCAMPTR